MEMWKEGLVMDAQALEQWKSKIFTYQQRTRISQAPQQTSLFNVAPSRCHPDTIVL